jgi:hypothetical protein
MASLDHSATCAGRFSGDVADAVAFVPFRTGLVSSESAILSGSTTCDAACPRRVRGWFGDGVAAGADDAVDERSRVSAARYAPVHMAAVQRSSWTRTRLPAGSRKAQSRTPYGCSTGSWTTSASPARSRSKVPSRSLVARRIQP